jgi:hypothetical protein
MSCITPARKPYRAVRGLRRIGTSGMILAGLALPLYAQSGDAATAGHRPHGDCAESGARPRDRIAGIGAIEGPASPAILRDTVGLSGAKLQQYSKQHDAYSASTKAPQARPMSSRRSSFR